MRTGEPKEWSISCETVRPFIWPIEAVRVDADDAVPVFVEDLLLPHVVTEYFFRKRLSDVVDADLALSLRFSERGRLDEDFRDFVELRRELVFVLDETRGPFDDLADRRRREMQLAFALDEPRDEARYLHLAFVRARHLRVELRLYLEDFRKFRVVYIQQVI